MFNRRYYERMNIGVKCVLYLQSGEEREVSAILRDVSESGIGLLLPDYENLAASLKEGLEMTFIFCDSYRVYGEIVDNVVEGNAKVVRTAVTEEGIILGCILTNPRQLESYIRDRKVAYYLNSLQTFDS